MDHISVFQQISINELKCYIMRSHEYKYANKHICATNVIILLH